MQEILEVSCRPVHDGIWTPAELMGALERAATDHADALNIGHDRMVADFGSLWMLVRSRLELTRLPAADEALTVRTWLRSPTPVMSVRDYDFCADGEVIGSAVHCWVLVNAEARHMIDLRQIPALWELPVHVPERKTRLRRLTLPETMTAAGAVRVTDAEIDDNGHMNNVAYVRRAQEAAPGLFRGLEVVYRPRMLPRGPAHARACRRRGRAVCPRRAGKRRGELPHALFFARRPRSGGPPQRCCACCSCAPAPRRSRRTPCRRSWPDSWVSAGNGDLIETMTLAQDGTISVQCTFRGKDTGTIRGVWHADGRHFSRTFRRAPRPIRPNLSGPLTAGS